MWVPFNLVFLPKFFQHIFFQGFMPLSCEFLSIWYFYRSSFNKDLQQQGVDIVVSSFQFGIFTEVLSTESRRKSSKLQLWVPFNLVFLPKFFQLQWKLTNQTYCCEFLSIWYFYRSSFNLASGRAERSAVVSSFQFGIFTEVLSTIWINDQEDD